MTDTIALFCVAIFFAVAAYTIVDSKPIDLHIEGFE